MTNQEAKYFAPLTTYEIGASLVAMEFLSVFKKVSNVIVDAYYVVDSEGQILEYNRAFYALFPKQVARKLKGVRIGDVMEIGRDVAAECMEAGRHVRLDEIVGTVKASGEEIRMILSGIPIQEDTGVVGALVVLRNVTDEAMVQIKYQDMLENEARERQRLQEKIERRTDELLESNEALLSIQRELIRYKKGLLL